MGIKNLLTALMSKTSFQKKEKETGYKDYALLSQRVRELEELYRQAEERMDAYEKNAKGYQALIENLRRRVAEKNEEICEYESLYDKLQKEYEQLKTQRDDRE